MPTWSVAERTYHFPTRVAFLDTNVLIAVVQENDGRHGHTEAVLELQDYHWCVTHSCVLEAWNFLAGKQKNRRLAIQLIDWLFTPGNAFLISDAVEPLSTAHLFSQQLHVDIVDANLVDVANRLTVQCDLKPWAHIATYDTRDFLRIHYQKKLKFNVFDMEHMESTA